MPEWKLSFSLGISLQKGAFMVCYGFSSWNVCTLVNNLHVSRIPIAGGNLNHDRSWFGLLNIGRSDGASEKLVAFGGYGTNGYLQSMEVKKTFFGKIEKKIIHFFSFLI